MCIRDRYIMKWITLACIMWVVIGSSSVLQLHDDNFKATINKGRPVLVKFFVSWCAHSKALAPEYEKVAEEAKNEPFIVGEVDGSTNKGLVVAYDVKGYPTIKLFVDGIVVDYEGERKAHAILEFMRKKVKTNSKELLNESAAKEVLISKGRRCILISDNEEDKKNFALAAKLIDEFSFFHTSQSVGKEVFKGVDLPCAIVLRDFGEPQIVYKGQFDHESLVAFLRKHQFDLVVPFNNETVRAIFQKAFRKGVLLMLPGEGEVEKLKGMFMQLAESRQSDELLFVVASPNEHWGKKYIEHYEIKNKRPPFVEIIDKTKDVVKRMEFKGNFTFSSLQQFLDQNTERISYKYFKTENSPESSTGLVYKAVAQTFYKEVVANECDVLVKFHTERCAGCKEMEKVYKEVAEAVGDNKKLKLLEINGMKNDVPVYVESYPVLYLYLIGKKDTPIKYTGRTNKEELISFLKEKCTKQIEVKDMPRKIEEKPYNTHKIDL
eukprot:TRINITY_DN15621_c0_g2_i4.p1 TRINITY_DN15621_c0_g2~~TRINITY_DN15621_c0_g2_i4.p1  ORF type:complete len:493 (-),score=112.24 TRINITY_DN15621_c0_g2_i4:131-1609(-)